MAEVYLDIIARIDKVQADIKNLQGEMTKLGTKSEEVNQKVRQEFEQTGDIANKLRPLIAGIFSIAAITGFIKKLIEVRSEWEKQSAIIKTVTGSQYQANEAMKMLRKISDISTTSVKELSDAYIRLLGQGIKPTYDQMKKMMDVAISANRSFGELSEAIFDAVNQQTRGLKNFRINSKIEGDKIILSFKGMTETVDLTSEAITGFVLKVADLQGVAGSTEAVAKTITGTVDDFGDAWEHFFEDVSKSSTGFITNLTKIATSGINIIDFFVKSSEKYKYEEKMQMYIDDLLYAFDKIKAETKNVTIEEIRQAGAIETVQKKIKALTDILPTLSEKELPAAERALYNLNQELKRLMGLGTGTPNIKLENIIPKDIKEIITDSLTPDVKLIGESYNELITLYVEYVNKLNEERLKETWWEKLTEDEKLAIKEESLYTAESLIDSLSQFRMRNMDAELAATEGNEAKQLEIRKKYARQEQVFSIGRALISGAEAMLRIAAQYAPPVSTILQVLQGIQTAAQIAVIKSAKFATGVLDLKGRGTGTSDSIPAMLSRGESVMTANETKEFYPYLKAMKDGKFPKLQMELMNDFAKLQGITNNNLNYDNSKEIRKLEEIRKALLREQQSETIEGKYKIIRRGNITTKISLN
jgi:hypothetical protein